MNRSFDFYEYAGILVPGAVLIIGLLQNIVIIEIDTTGT